MIALLVFLLVQNPGTDVESVYLHGLEAARAAARVGGSPASLVPVQEAIDRLDQIAAGAHGPAEIAKYVLMAAAVGAQEEREQMGLLLEQAVWLERQQLDAHQPGAPVVTAHEAAGDLWLQVRRYEDATRAYETARAVIGSTPRIEAGLARAREALAR